MSSLREEVHLLFALLVLMLLNLCDWALTQDAIALGVAREGNPVGAAMLSCGLWQSLVIKAGVVLVGCLGLYVVRRRRWGRVLLWTCLGSYVAVVLYQVMARLVVL